MKIVRQLPLLSMLTIFTTIWTPVAVQGQANAPTTVPVSVVVGQKQKVKGIIVSLTADKLVVRDASGLDMGVSLTKATKIIKNKTNPSNTLLVGLEVKVEGRGDNTGGLIAEKVIYTMNAFRVARSINTRLDPLDTRVTTTEERLYTTENRLAVAEVNALRLAGQINEMAWISNTARGGAKAAQETADQALAAAQANSVELQAVNDRISAIDNYEAIQNIALSFRVNSAVLTVETKTLLDEVAARAKIEKGYLIQVTGYTSAEGNKSANSQLSIRRADAVKRYLAEHDDIPLQRIIPPYGFGEAKPVAENSTRNGRAKNRRVAVTILLNKGLAAPVTARNVVQK
ncbi:MAG: OmpA family protein [Chloracidobacterium sp.]|nr:OmpA family protein [Chloracidobacterium sp.]